MSETSGSKRLERWGLAATKVYLIVLVGGVPTLAYFGAIELHSLELNELGDFLAGAFGPLAIFWLVLGFFQQGEELRNSVKTLELQAKELASSVEQQKAMVGITEQQLKLDIKVREEQTKASISKELPFLQLKRGGGSSSGGRHRYDFTLTNIGAACTEGTLTLEKNDDIALTNNLVPYLDRNSAHQFSLAANDGRMLDETTIYTLEAATTNIRGQKRLQRFEFGSVQPTLVYCDPENQ
ncbi:hypothetical protein [Aliiroseovarius sp.]|uniref:hypothetical protein n=1 Tax=Aliiroseovarius sp. TaxID=1872442 RepID=UPI003BAAA01B